MPAAAVRVYTGSVTNDETTGETRSRVVAHARAVLAETVRTLRDAGLPREGLAEFVPARRVLLIFTKPATMRVLGEVWRLGRLLVTPEGEVFVAGRATRAAERGRPGYQSLSREERLDIAAAALHGGFGAGTPVNFDAAPVDLEAVIRGDIAVDHPLAFDGEHLRVRWSADAPLRSAPTFEGYLAERAALLIEPQG